MELKDKKFLVAGTGMSGIGTVKLLRNANAEVILYDGNTKLRVEDITDKLKAAGIKDYENIQIEIGELKQETANKIDICIISPGISLEVPFVKMLKSINKIIWGEIELAYRCSKGKIVAITGTNGKTTTTALTGKIMEKCYEKTFVVGNIGTPYSLMAEKTDDNSVTVAEISSFQLETIDEFHPNVSAVLNITPDHLDRHHSMDCYSDIKMSICKNQTLGEVCVLNYEDERLRKYAETLKCKPVFFSSKTKLNDGIFCDEAGNICISIEGRCEKLMNVSEMKLVGIHNAENVMAAIALAENLNIPREIYIDVIKNFNSIEHRIEYVDTINGVIYYNDSKGTNTDASKKALEAMTKKTVLIAGGYDKGLEYDDWVEAFGDRIKCLVLLGKTSDKIAKAARKKGFDNIIMVETLKEAVEVSAKNAKEGDAVLLSPACASWDMFKSYEERGNLFKEYIKSLKG